MQTHARALLGILLTLLSALSYAQAPVPFVNQPLVPDATAPGGPQFTLTVNGTGFVSSSVVNWNGNALATQFVSGSQLTATVPAADIATASTASVTVVNPAPGGGRSNLAFFTVTPNIGNSVTFVLASSPAVGSFPVSGVVGDFNQDGRLDLAVVNQQVNLGLNSTISILLGDGTGNFTQASNPTVGFASQSVAVGDFNGDGKADLAVSNFASATISILLGDGAGSLTPISSPGVGSWPFGLAVGDFNGDGKLDIATTNFYNGELSILLGDGTGSFVLASSPRVGSWPVGLAVGDFNGDGSLDLAVANQGSNTVSILLGDGTGNFALASSLPVGNEPWGVAAGDFNGDGKLDLATANLSDNTVSILLGDGTGNFMSASSLGVRSGPTSVAVGDFNGDSKLDLATASINDGGPSILLGDGSGNFSLGPSLSVDDGSEALVLSDFNGDGALDVVTVDVGNNTVSILLGVPPTSAVTLSPTSLTFGTQLFGTSSSPQSVTLTNIGSATLAITKGSISPNFSQTNNCPRSLPPGGMCTVNVVFTPRKVNTVTGALTITDNAPNSPQTVSLIGVGTAVSLVPSSLDFGSQPVGTTSQPQTVTLTNHATAALSIGNIQINPNFAQTNTCGTSVPAGGSCTISVTFTPTRKGSGPLPLVIYDNGGAGPQIVLVSGTGT